MSPRLRRLLSDPAGLAGGALVALVLVLAVVGPWIAPHPLDARLAHLDLRLQPPSLAFPFGTDHLGRDIFSRIVLGTRETLTLGLGVIVGALILGTPPGLVAGYADGAVSRCIMRVTDVVLSVPQLMLALALAQLLKPSLTSAMLALTLSYCPFFTRTVYAETRRVRAALFIDALHALGASPWRILLLHVLPNIASAIIVRATIGLGFVILIGATLGFLGMGPAPPAPDWGLMIAESRSYLPEHWWYALFPGLAITVAVVGFNLLGDALRDLADPRLRSSR